MSSSLSYIVDKNDVIISTDKGFADFASENNASGLECIVAKRSVWDFFADQNISVLYKNIFDGVRSSGQGVSFNFRCDSPDVLRFMTMNIEPLDYASLQISTNTLREISRQQALRREIFFLGINQGTSMCSHCNKVYIQSIKTWMEVKEAIEDGYFTDDISLKFSMCGGCIESLEQIAHGSVA